MALQHPTLQPGGYLYVGRNIKRDSEPLPPVTRSKNILYPSINPGQYPYIGKRIVRFEPNYLLKMQWLDDQSPVYQNPPKDEETPIRLGIKVEKRVEKKQIKAAIKQKVEAKIQAYEDAVNVRRAKLHDLFYNEEREYIRETVEMALQGKQRRFEEMKKKVETIKAQREAERQELVHKKKIEQYINMCEELKPALIKQHLIETKNCQLQQMRENEAKREANRELDRMWYELTVRENEAKIEREEREAMARKAGDLSVQETLAKQILGKELLKAEERKMVLEDKLEFDRLTEQRKNDEFEKLKKKKQDQESMLNQVKEEIRVHEEFIKKRKEEDEAVARAVIHYNQFEVEKEKALRKEKIERTKREAAIYREYMKELEIERKKQEEELECTLQNYTKEIERKRDDAECKIKLARLALHKEAHQGNMQQIELRRQEAESELRKKQAENELIRLAFATNTKLQEESNRLEREVNKQYREDLKRQIVYNNELRERERQELERQLQKGLEEEEKYQKLVKEIIKVKLESPELKHPFRRVLERYDCRCKVPPS